MRTLLLAVALLLTASACKKHDSNHSLTGNWFCVKDYLGPATLATRLRPPDSTLKLLLGPNGYYAEFWINTLIDTGTYSTGNVSPAGSPGGLLPGLVLRSNATRLTTTFFITWSGDTLILDNGDTFAGKYWYVRVGR